MSKHTPGPWRVHEPDDGSEIEIQAVMFRPDEWHALATMAYTSGPDREDARLIAEAPAMYAVLGQALALLTEHGDRTGNYAGCADIRAILDRVGEGE